MNTCKFCGGPLAGNGDWKHCPTCGKYCMCKCEGAADGRNWHKEPCITCEHNPYRIRHIWDGERWKVKA